jgi:hypothetical protein
MKRPVLLFSAFVFSLGLSAQTVLFSDDIESYTTGTGIAAQSDDWDTWDGSAAYDAPVSEDFANSGTKSIKIEGTNADLVLPLGPVNSGKYDVRWKMYIPAGSSGAYFNALHQWANNNMNYQWAVDVFFTGTGSVNITAGGTPSTGVATVPVGQWFDVQVTADMDADVGKVYLSGQVVSTWQWSLNNANGAAGLNQLAAIDFYGTNAANGQGLYYVDDVAVIESTGVGVVEAVTQSTPKWYPNPAIEILHVELPSWAVGGTLNVLDLTGRVVLSSAITRENLSQRMDVSTLTTGIYLVKVIHGNEVFTGKVTVRR